jgi:hypothetical protein
MSKNLSFLLVLIVVAAGVLIGFQQLRPLLRSEVGSPAETNTAEPAGNSRALHEAMLAFAQCMRDNGISNFPDPSGGELMIDRDEFDVESPAFQAAQGACESLIPPPPAGSVPDELSVAELAAWVEVVPGGDTMCADGSEYAFWVHPADPAKVVFFLEGGGACWDATTCAFSDDDSRTYDWKVTDGDNPAYRGGIFDLDHPDNPLAGYSFVYVPYCTGDVYLGNVIREYSPELTVRHNGFVNGTAALTHLVANYPHAEQVVVAGVSAGSVAAPVYGGLVTDVLPNAQVTVLADSSGAYPNDLEMNARILGQWGTGETMPDWEVNEGLPAEVWGIPQFWIQAGTHDPEMVLARFDYAFDEVQVQYLTLTGLNPSNLIALMDANEALIEAAGVVQHSYTAAGSNHTIINNEEFYTMAVNGVALVEWVEAVIAGEPLVDVHCDPCVVE